METETRIVRPFDRPLAVREERESQRVLVVAAALSFLAAGIHVAAAEAEAAVAYSLMFHFAALGMGLYALGLGLQAIWNPESQATLGGGPWFRQAYYVLGIVAYAAVVALFLASRTVGVPGIAEGRVLAWTELGVASVVVEVLTIVALARLVTEVRPAVAGEVAPAGPVAARTKGRLADDPRIYRGALVVMTIGLVARGLALLGIATLPEWSQPILGLVTVIAGIVAFVGFALLDSA
ncbi:MAG: hypothetical protein ACT4PT_12800 [Methanobacteriota archaeon]